MFGNSKKKQPSLSKPGFRTLSVTVLSFISSRNCNYFWDVRMFVSGPDNTMYNIWSIKACRNIVIVNNNFLRTYTYLAWLSWIYWRVGLAYSTNFQICITCVWRWGWFLLFYPLCFPAFKGSCFSRSVVHWNETWMCCGIQARLWFACLVQYLSSDVLCQGDIMGSLHFYLLLFVASAFLFW